MSSTTAPTSTSPTATQTAPAASSPLLLGVEGIAALRSRGDQPSDGGGTGRSDSNDGFH